MAEERFLNVQEVAVRYGISNSTVYNWVNRGYLPKPIKFSERTSRWSLNTLERWETEKGYQVQQKAFEIDDVKAEVIVSDSNMGIVLIILLVTIAAIYAYRKIANKKENKVLEPAKPLPVEEERSYSSIICVNCTHGASEIHPKNIGADFNTMLCFKNNFIVLSANGLRHEEQESTEFCCKKNPLGYCKDYEYVHGEDSK